MNKYFCKACNQKSKIKLMSDYSSNHIWCDNCGVEIDINELNISDCLKLLIEHWGLIWEVSVSYLYKLSYNKQYLEELYKKTGYCIEKELSNYYECYFKDLND